MNDRRWIVRRFLRGAIFVAALASCLLLAADALACPTCKEGLAENDPQARGLAAGFYYSILLMMSMPFIILGTFGTFAYRSVRRAQAAREASAGDGVPG
jgi:hypothetical protein